VNPDNEVGWYLLGGLSLELREGVSLFGEIRYFVLEADTKAALDSIEGIDKDLEFDGFGINIGISMRW